MTDVASGCFEKILDQYHGEIPCFTASKLAASIGWDALNKAIAAMRKHDFRAVADGSERLGSNPIFVVWPGDDNGDYLSICLYSQTPTIDRENKLASKYSWAAL